MIVCPVCFICPEIRDPDFIPTPYAECTCGRLIVKSVWSFFAARLPPQTGGPRDGPWMRVRQDGTMEASVREPEFPGGSESVPDAMRDEVVRTVIEAAIADSVLSS